MRDSWLKCTIDKYDPTFLSTLDNDRKTFTDMHTTVFEHSYTLSLALLACYFFR